MILFGAGILMYSLPTVSQIIQELPSGKVQSRWHLLRFFILLFIAGYSGYPILCYLGKTPVNLLVALIFFFGSIFVIVVCRLALESVQDIKRITILEIETITDQLMGIFNRRYLDNRLKEEVDRSRRYGIDFSLILLDIDHFKNVNDQYGHQNGDIILTQIGRLLKQAVRTVDIVARFGGEEVVILLPSTGPDGAFTLAERIRQLIESNSFILTGDYDGQTISCTVSIGIVSQTDAISETDELLLCADKAMYEAKKAGRNKVVVAQDVG